jgi:hypothetical protein
VFVRVWWSLYHLERQIGIMTGRPSMIVEQCCSVPLPAPFSEQQILENAHLVDDLRGSAVASTASPLARSRSFVDSHFSSDSDLGKAAPHLDLAEANAGSYFRAVVQLCTITQSITASLYTARTKVRSPDELHQDIVQLGQRLDDWLTKLPRDLNFQTHPDGSMALQDPFLRERRLLTFQFYSATILLTRPCLSSFEGSAKHAEETTIPADFTQRMAGTCVETAKAVVDLLPDQPQPRFLYEYGPWWTIVHNLMQALAVLLLALSYSSKSPQGNAVLAEYCQKTIRWLCSLNDPLANRAYRVALGCFEVTAKRLSLPIPDELFMGNASPVPSGDRSLEGHIVHPGAPLPVPNVSYNHVGVTDDLSAFLLYGFSTINDVNLPLAHVQTSYQHQRGI